MCGVCGCGEGETRMEAEQKVLEHTGHAHVHHSHSHNHDHDHDHGHEHNHHEHAHDAHTAEVHMLRDDPAQRAHLVSVEQDILSKNDALAAHNRQQRLTRLQAFELSAGQHVLKLAPRESIYIDLIAVTDNPAMFD